MVVLMRWAAVSISDNFFDMSSSVDFFFARRTYPRMIARGLLMRCFNVVTTSLSVFNCVSLSWIVCWWAILLLFSSQFLAQLDHADERPCKKPHPQERVKMRKSLGSAEMLLFERHIKIQVEMK